MLLFSSTTLFYILRFRFISLVISPFLSFPAQGKPRPENRLHGGERLTPPPSSFVAEASPRLRGSGSGSTATCAAYERVPQGIEFRVKPNPS